MVNVVVTCTKSKTASVPKSLRLRAVRSGSIEDRAESWFQRVKKTASERIKVRNLYKGDHWSAAKAIDSFAGGRKHQVWVSSAGFGVLSLEDSLPAYSATFSGAHPDCVVSKSDVYNRRIALSDWWQAVCDWPNSSLRPRRSLESIALEAPSQSLIIVGSDEYLHAMHQDLLRAVAALERPSLLSIFSAGCKELDGLDDSLVRYDARMQGFVGGALRSLNMRVACWALEECGKSKPTYSLLQKRVADQLSKQPDFSMPVRKQMSDDAVRRFILKELIKDSKACHSPLLRKLRKANMACEQKRFANLFREVKGQLDG